jgi:hypothetical protein
MYSNNLARRTTTTCSNNSSLLKQYGASIQAVGAIQWRNLLFHAIKHTTLGPFRLVISNRASYVLQHNRPLSVKANQSLSAQNYIWRLTWFI